MRLDSRFPKLCLSLTERTLEEDLTIVERERERVDMVELRVDSLTVSELPNIKNFPAASGLPSILAFRRESEGGFRAIDERTRLRVLEKAAEGNWSFVDLEDDLHAPGIEKAAALRGVTIIRSFHDFTGVPADLTSRVGRLARGPKEVPKVAVMPRSTADLLRILDAGAALVDSPAIVVGMGEWGFPSRVLPSNFSSVLSYSTAGALKAAPGHVDPFTLRTVYRLGETGPSTRIFCIIGNPVLHSRSPWIHNPGFKAIGLDAVYVPIQVDDLDDFFALADRWSITGTSITVPHKETVRTYLARSDGTVVSVGACNTLVRGREGWKGYNTDVAGFIGPLESRLGKRLSGSRALVVGAGGAARAVVYGLLEAGARVTIVNRTDRRAAKLASYFGCDWADQKSMSGARRPEYEIVVQATSVGMTPNEEADPLPSFEFSGTEIVYELVYAPSRTRFLERAAASGCTTIEGREMLLQQAFVQFRLFTGQDYPSEEPESL